MSFKVSSHFRVLGKCPSHVWHFCLRHLNKQQCCCFLWQLRSADDRSFCVSCMIWIPDLFLSAQVFVANSNPLCRGQIKCSISPSLMVCKIPGRNSFGWAECPPIEILPSFYHLAFNKLSSCLKLLCFYPHNCSTSNNWKEQIWCSWCINGRAPCGHKWTKRNDWFTACQITVNSPLYRHPRITVKS